MKSFRFLSLAMIVAITAFTGCGGSSTNQPTAKSNGAGAQPAGRQTQAAAQAISEDFQLVGVWLGTSNLDTAALEAKLASLDPEAAEQLRATVATFDSIYIAAQYNADQTMEQDMTIQPTGGEALRDQSFGAWQASRTDRSLTVTTVEQNGAEGERTTKQYTIIDADHFVLIPPVSEDLKDLSPVVYFERVSDQQIPLSAEAGTVEDVR